MIDDYLNDVVELLASCGAVDAEASITSDETQGLLDATLMFPGDLYLDVALTVEMTLGYPAWKSYGFHFRTAQESCVFRYDMAPHHKWVPTFPHHKHVGSDERVLPSAQPTIHEIRNEIISYLDVDWPD